MKALTLSTARRRKPIVILTGPAIGAKSSTNHFPGVKKLMRVLVSEPATYVYTTAGALAMMFFAMDCNTTGMIATTALTMPWAFVGLARVQKGGTR